MDIDDVRTVAVGAAVLAGVIGSALTLAVLGAMVEAMLPGTMGAIGTGAVSALSVSLRAFLLVTVGVVAFLTLAGVLLVAMFRLVTAPIRAVLVTYVHTGSAGRHGVTA